MSLWICWSCTSIPIPRTDLAHYLCTRPETLSRAIHELQQSGLIRIVAPNEFEVLDLAVAAETLGFVLRARADCVIRGPKGNQETFIWLRKSPAALAP